MNENNKVLLEQLQPLIKSIAMGLQETAKNMQGVYEIIEEMAAILQKENCESSINECLEIQPVQPAESTCEAIAETQETASSENPDDEPAEIVAEQDNAQSVPVEETEEYQALSQQMSDKIEEFNRKEEEYLNKIRVLEEQLEKTKTNKYKELCKSLLLREVNAIKDPITNFVNDVLGCYEADKDVIHHDASNIKDGYEQFCHKMDAVIENEETEIETEIVDILLNYLDNNSNSWVNTIFRLSEYTKIETCNIVESLANNLKDAGEILSSMYSRYGIEIVIPTLLVDKFDEECFDFDNSGTIWINKYCKLNQQDFKQKVYDLVQVGYATVDRTAKPKVFVV